MTNSEVHLLSRDWIRSECMIGLPLDVYHVVVFSSHGSNGGDN